MVVAESLMRKKSGLGVAVSAAGVFAAAVALGGCYQTSAPPQPVAAAGPRAPAPPQWPRLPENATCSSDLNRYQAILWSDVTTGNLNVSVYDKIEANLNRAADACAGGNDGEARAIIRSTKLNYGYRAYL
jgi:hypothetical protein